MKGDHVQWRPIVQDLALHLGSALNVEQVRHIIDVAERDLARLDHPSDFWDRVESEYDKVIARLGRLANHDRGQRVEDCAGTVRALIAAKRPK